MVPAIIVVALVAIGSALAARVLHRRYRDLYGAEEPPYEDPPVIPIQGSHGGLM